jgi:hypothetical protein
MGGGILVRVLKKVFNRMDKLRGDTQNYLNRSLKVYRMRSHHERVHHNERSQ